MNGFRGQRARVPLTGGDAWSPLVAVAITGLGHTRDLPPWQEMGCD